MRILTPYSRVQRRDSPLVHQIKEEISALEFDVPIQKKMCTDRSADG